MKDIFKLGEHNICGFSYSKIKSIKTFKRDGIIVDGRPLEEVVNEFSFGGTDTAGRTRS